MNSAPTQREDRILRSVASEYEENGYQVKLLPTAADLPGFLAAFKPDLIASGKGEVVVVEVKARNELANDQTVAAIEAALKNQPGWRFELIIEGSDQPTPCALDASQIRHSIDEANALHQDGHLVAALLLLWSAIEGILRRVADRENVELESGAPLYITQRLYTLGLLAREQYRVLDEAIRLRNGAAHGFQTAVTSEDLTTLEATARQLLSEVDRPI